MGGGAGGRNWTILPVQFPVVWTLSVRKQQFVRANWFCREPLKGCGDSSGHRITHCLLRFIFILIMKHSSQALFLRRISAFEQVSFLQWKNSSVLKFHLLSNPEVIHCFTTTDFLLPGADGPTAISHSCFPKRILSTLQLMINTWNEVGSICTQRPGCV